MATFTRVQMPRANEFVSSDGSLTSAALNYLGYLEKLTQSLTAFNGSDDAFLVNARSAATVANSAVSDVTVAYSTLVTLADALTALFEIKNTTIPGLNTNIAAIQSTLNQILAALKAANLMEP